MEPKKLQKEKFSDKRTRGPTSQKTLVGNRAKEIIQPVEFDQSGEAIGSSRVAFNTALGRAVRSHIPCICQDANMTDEHWAETWADIKVR